MNSENLATLLFLLAGLFVIVGFYSVFISPLAKKASLPSPEERNIYIFFTLLIFIFVGSLVIRFIYLWVIGLRNESFMSLNSDQARIVYESRTILGYAEAVVIASVALFFPLLVLTWNNAQVAVSNALEKLIALRNNQTESQSCLGDAINSALADLEYLRETGREFRGLFFVTIIGVAFFLVTLVLANFLSWQPLHVYIFVVVLKGIAVVIALWLLTLLLIYLFLVQPVVRETQYPRIFDLDVQQNR
jgi:hypothetical protein